MNRKLIAALAVFLVTLLWMPPAVQADPGKFAGLETFLDKEVEKQLSEHDIPGASVTVVSKGKQVFSKGYGVSNVKTNAAVDPASTGFFTGSVSKVFIAQAVMQQEKAGKIDLDTDVNKYLDFAIDNAYPGEPVTMRHLLTHTGGFDEDLVGKMETDPTQAPALGEWVKDNQPPRVREPGTVISYDNYGTALAAHVVERVSKESFEDYVKAHIFKPLEMHGTTMHTPLPDTIESSTAMGYRDDGTTPVPRLYSGMAPAGIGPVTTSQDMGRWMIAQMSGGSSSNDQIAEEMAKLQYQQDERIPGGVGYLYEEYERGGVRLVNKGGDVDGFHPMMSMVPEHETGIYVAFNGDGAAGAQSLKVTDAFVDRYFAEDTDNPEPTGGDVSRYEGSYGASRNSRSSMLGVAGLLTPPASVEASGEGELTTTGLAIDETKPQTWDQIKPGVFAERDGTARIAFDDEGNIASSELTIITFQKLAWHDNPQLHLAFGIFGAVTALAGLLALPIVALTRRLRGRSRHSRASRAARLLAIVNGALLVCAVAGYSLLFSDPLKIMLPSLWLTALPVLTGIQVLSSIAMVAPTVAAWWKGWWGMLGRIGYSLLTTGALSIGVVAISYHLTAL